MSYLGTVIHDPVSGSMDEERKTPRNLTLNDSQSSAIHSDILSSLPSQDGAFEQLSQPKLMVKNYRSGRYPLRRLQSNAHIRRNNSMNQTKLSTQYEGYGSGKHEDLYSAPGFSELKEPAKQAVSTISDRTHLKRKEQAQIYAQVEDLGYDKTKRDPYQVIDKRTHKIAINPGVPYISTSHDAVFEIRNAKELARIGKQVNHFIASPREDDASVMDSEYEQNLLKIKPVHPPHRLFASFKPVQRLEFEVDDDEDNDDALVLMRQPYETVMQIGFHDLLTHIDAKQHARRSDIIVSSTLSITMTPKDDEYESKMTKFALVSEEDVAKWVAKRHIYRSIGVRQAGLSRLKQSGRGAPDEDSDEVENDEETDEAELSAVSSDYSQEESSAGEGSGHRLAR